MDVSGQLHIRTILFSWIDSPSGPRTSLRGSLITLRHTHTRYDSSEWEIGPSHRHLHDNTQQSQETHASSRRDSNPQSQQATDHLERGTTRIGSGHFDAGKGPPPPHFLVNRRRWVPERVWKFWRKPFLYYSFRAFLITDSWHSTTTKMHKLVP
jgi:hypothetical protein